MKLGSSLKEKNNQNNLLSILCKVHMLAIIKYYCFWFFAVFLFCTKQGLFKNSRTLPFLVLDLSLQLLDQAKFLLPSIFLLE